MIFPSVFFRKTFYIKSSLRKGRVLAQTNRWAKLPAVQIQDTTSSAFAIKLSLAVWQALFDLFTKTVPSARRDPLISCSWTENHLLPRSHFEVDLDAFWPYVSLWR